MAGDGGRSAKAGWREADACLASTQGQAACACCASVGGRTVILALDPGTTETGWCEFVLGRVANSGVMPNVRLLGLLQEITSRSHTLAIEMIASLGMPVGREVFETCVWIGRFQQAWHTPDAVRLVYRRDVKLHLCGNARAKDSNIRQALLDLIGPQGTKKAPGPCYGVKSHAWAALGVAVTVAAAMGQESASPGLFAPTRSLANNEEFFE